MLPSAIRGSSKRRLNLEVKKFDFVVTIQLCSLILNIQLDISDYHVFHAVFLK